MREGSALDLEARRRATTVYLIQKTVPMLPPLLCEQLCRSEAKGKGREEKGGGGGLGLIVLGCGLLRFVLSRLVSCVFVVCLMCCPSLNPGVERLSFSVVWRMNEDGTMVRHITQTSTLPCRHTELDTETHDSTLRHCTEY